MSNERSRRDEYAATIAISTIRKREAPEGLRLLDLDLYGVV